MLSFSNITVRLGGKLILDKASASLPPRSRVGLIGRNGAGKSTLMRIIAGLAEPDEGSVDMPRGARLGYVSQEAPGGTITPFETVLAADTERSSLLVEADTCEDAQRVAEIHERLNAIDAHSAPARAARILVGLGFDEDMQHRPMDSFSGGWRMRVALAALLFSSPDLLLLDEPSNHLDLEATLWLENFLRSYRATILVISHERDLLNKVVDHILHLDRGQATLYPGGYDAFERQRAERLAQQSAAREKQTVEREKLQAFVDRWRAKASKAKQAQSRMKALAKMTPVAELMADPTLSFHFPSPAELRPPLITLDDVAIGYGDRTILSRLKLRLDPDDRIALLGRNGNGKTTLARLLAGQLEPLEGQVTKSGKLNVGYFTQYQVEELDREETPYTHMARLMPDAKPAEVRGQLGRFGFSGDKATTLIRQLSGGERARLALALITRDAPHLLILDEPTNHLDVDAREALVQALNAYEGAVVVVSHDRHMIELTADRLFLVDDGTAREFEGSLEDYTDFVLGRGGEQKSSAGASRPSRKDERRAAAEAREKTQTLRKQIAAFEKKLAALVAQRDGIDLALGGSPSAPASERGRPVPELMKRRADVEREREAVEVEWLQASEALEQRMQAA